jgi:hypothetical protein
VYHQNKKNAKESEMRERAKKDQQSPASAQTTISNPSKLLSSESLLDLVCTSAGLSLSPSISPCTSTAVTAVLGGRAGPFLVASKLFLGGSAGLADDGTRNPSVVVVLANELETGVVGIEEAGVV